MKTESPAHRVGEDFSADAPGIGGHAHEGDALRLEDAVESVDIHGGIVPHREGRFNGWGKKNPRA